MTHSTGYQSTGSLRIRLKLNKAQPELSTGLSSIRCTFEKTLRPLFNNPDMDNQQFLNALRNILGCWIKYEHLIITPDSDSIVDILKSKGLYLSGK